MKHDSLDSETPIIFYDGVCGLCNRFVRWAIARDPSAKLKLAPLQGSTAGQLLGPIPSPPDSIILWNHGQAWRESSAALKILTYLKFPWPIFSVFRLVPPLIRNPIYRWVARNRYRWFGKSEVCELPPAEIRERFLD